MTYVGFFKSIVLLFCVAFLLHSCASKADVIYFQNAPNFETIVNTNNHASKFKVDDLISINIATLNPEASAPFNMLSGVMEGSGQTAEQLSYLVDSEGEIDFPVIGKLKVLGLTQEGLRTLLKKELEPYLKNPIINIRLRNFTVTVIGEVNKPGTYPVVGEQITILEALGYAGDMTIKGMRKNVLVIRDFNGTKVYNRIDLTDKKALDSPVFYLTQNDVVYVEPNKSAITSSSLDNRANIAVTVASIIITSSIILITRSN